MKNCSFHPKLFDDTPFVKYPQIPILKREWQTSFPNITKTKSRKLTYQNTHLTHGLHYVGKNELPQVKPYTGSIPILLTPYTMKHAGDTTGAIHFYVDDYRFTGIYLWGHIDQFTTQVAKYASVIAPDYSLYLDQSRTLNLFQIYQNRVVTAIWQQQGLNVIPSVSWGNADSFEYCLDALPQNSVLAIGGLGIAHHQSMIDLWEYGVHQTIRQLHPKALIFYGAPKKLDLPVETYYFTDYIHSKLRK